LDIWQYDKTDDEMQATVLNLLGALPRKRVVGLWRTESNVVAVMCAPYANLQFILKNYTSLSDILNSFDLDCCKFAYDGFTVMCTPAAALAVKTRLVPIKTLQYKEQRVRKYMLRGFAFVLHAENDGYQPNYAELRDSLTDVEQNLRFAYGMTPMTCGTHNLKLEEELAMFSWLYGLIREPCNAGYGAFKAPVFDLATDLDPYTSADWHHKGKLPSRAECHAERLSARRAQASNTQPSPPAAKRTMRILLQLGYHVANSADYDIVRPVSIVLPNAVTGDWNTNDVTMLLSDDFDVISPDFDADLLTCDLATTLRNMGIPITNSRCVPQPLQRTHAHVLSTHPSRTSAVPR
jgi:hypothetical protein